MGFFASDRYPRVLFGLFLVEWVAWAIAPPDRATWFAENILVFLFVPLVLWTWWRFRLSNVSYTLVFLYLSLHVVGAHYGYSNVPFEWVKFGTGRNHYDRLVHFSFGLLMAYPIREVFHRVANARGFWGYYLPLDVTLAFSAVYEVFEWVFSLVASQGQGAAFLGSQGDEFDAVKDMALAGTGAVIAMTITALIGWRFNRDFLREWRASLKLGRSEPRGEVTFSKWRRAR